MSKEGELLGSLETLIEQEKKLLESIENQQSGRKDLWDRFSTISTFLSSVVVAVIGLYITTEYNENQALRASETQKYQTRVLEMQTIEKFIPHLSGKEEETKKVALLALTSLGSPEFATRFAQLSPSKGTQAAADVIMATAQSKAQVEVFRPVVTKTNQISKSGWAYLGHYVNNDGRWETKYFKFSDNAQPSSFIGKTLQVRAETGQLNVRVDMPTPFGLFPKVIDVLKTGSSVTIQDVQEWQSSGYMWAKIGYSTD